MIRILTEKVPGQPARAERRRGPISLAGLIPAPVFRPKLKTANRSEPKLEMSNDRRLGPISFAGLIPAPVFRPKLKTANRSEPKLEISNDRRLGTISLAGLKGQ